MAWRNHPERLIPFLHGSLFDGSCSESMIGYLKYIMEQIVRDNLLQDLIAAPGNFHQAPHGLTFNKVLMDTSLGAVKIRAYSNIEHARNIEAILLKIAEKIEYPEFFGSWEQYLIFKYLEVDPDDLKLREQETYFGIGKFLASLSFLIGCIDLAPCACFRKGS
jgi:hypothetical protein